MCQWKYELCVVLNMYFTCMHVKDGALGACCPHITGLRDNNDAPISAALARLTAGHEA